LSDGRLMQQSAASRATLFRRLALVLAALQVLALIAFIRSLTEGDEGWAVFALWLIGGAWAAGWWATVQHRRARIVLGLANPHRLEGAWGVIFAAALAPVATLLAYCFSLAAGVME
jgi:hypothetical protein